MELTDLANQRRRFGFTEPGALNFSVDLGALLHRGGKIGSEQVTESKQLS